jgi:hypothetical protein
MLTLWINSVLQPKRSTKVCCMPTETHRQTPSDHIRRALDAGQTVDLDTLSVRIIEDAAAFDHTYPEHALLLRKVEPDLKPKRTKQITL